MWPVLRQILSAHPSRYVLPLYCKMRVGFLAQVTPVNGPRDRKGTYT